MIMEEHSRKPIESAYIYTIFTHDDTSPDEKAYILHRFNDDAKDMDIIITHTDTLDQTYVRKRRICTIWEMQIGRYADLDETFYIRERWKMDAGGLGGDDI